MAQDRAIGRGPKRRQGEWEISRGKETGGGGGMIVRLIDKVGRMKDMARSSDFNEERRLVSIRLIARAQHPLSRVILEIHEYYINPDLRQFQIDKMHLHFD